MLILKSDGVFGTHSKLRAEETGVDSFKGNPSDGSQAKIDCRWCVLLPFEINPLPQNYGAIQSEPRL